MFRFSATRILFVTAFLAILSACSSGPQIISNRAPDFDLANYRSFGFFSPLSTDRGSTRSIDSQQLIEATSRELEARGLVRDDANPDLLVNFLLASRETLETRPSTTPSMSMSYGRGRYGTWGGYGMGVGTTTEIVQRTEGTLSVDVVDRQRNQLVWEGSATARVTDAMRENRRTVMASAIRDIFQQFP